MALELHTDECADARIVAALRHRGIVLRTAAEEGLLGAPDEQHLERAIQTNRVLLSEDHDFLYLVQALLGAGRSFPGLIFRKPTTNVGDVVRAIVHLSATRTPAEMRDRIEWVP